MHIKVNFNGSFYGTIHARDFRTPTCMSVGDGGKSVTLNISLLAPQGSPDYCGLLVNNVSINWFRIIFFFSLSDYLFITKLYKI